MTDPSKEVKPLEKLPYVPPGTYNYREVGDFLAAAYNKTDELVDRINTQHYDLKRLEIKLADTEARMELLKQWNDELEAKLNDHYEWASTHSHPHNHDTEVPTDRTEASHD